MKPRVKRPVLSARMLPSPMTVAAICLGLSAVKFALDDRPTEAMACSSPRDTRATRGMSTVKMSEPASASGSSVMLASVPISDSTRRISSPMAFTSRWRSL